MKKRLVLWDIDGTLVRSGVVGAEVFDLAIERVLGKRPRAKMVFSGKTDHQIVEEFLAMEGSEDPDHVPIVRHHLERELALQADRIASRRVRRSQGAKRHFVPSPPSVGLSRRC